MGERVRVAAFTELPLDTGHVVEVAGGEIALFRVGTDEVCAMENVCPHREGPIGEGDIEGDIVTCPWHAWEVNVRTGEVVDFPEMKTQTLPCHVLDGEVFIEV